MLRRLEKGLTSAKSAANAQQTHAPSQLQQQHSPQLSTNGGEPSSSPSSSSRPSYPPVPTTGSTRERSHSISTTVNFASPTNATSGWTGHGHGSPPIPSQPPSGNGAGGPVQYIQIPEYQQQAAAMQTSPASSIHMPLGSGSIAGGSITHSPPMSRKRRSRSPSIMRDDRYHPHHRSSTLTSNVRGTDDGDDTDNDDLGQATSSEEDIKPDTSAPNDYSMFPANLLAEEKRTSFFKTILNPPHSDNRGGHGGSAGGTGSEKSSGGGAATASGGSTSRKRELTSSPQVSGNAVSGSNGASGPEGQPKHVFGVKKPPPTFEDPITVGLITEEEAKTLFEL